MRCAVPCIIVALLLTACGQPTDDIDFVPVGGVNPDLQEFAIVEFENSGIDYRVTEKGFLEADFSRAKDIVEIVTRIWETHLPTERSFSINPDYLTAFRTNLDEASIPYHSMYVDELEWTVVEERDASRARQILNRVFGMGAEEDIWDGVLRE
jgi:hypothetical protein